MKRLIMLMVACIMITGCSVTKTQERIEDVVQTPTQEENGTDALVDSDEIETVEEIPTLDNIDVSIVNEEVQIQPLEIVINTLENKYNENNVLLAHVKIEYPIIQNALEDEGLTKINEFFEESAQALYEENNTYASDNVESIKEEALGDINSQDYSEYIVTFETKYNANGYLSILEKFSENICGVENPNIYTTGYVFDIRTGERLVINEILLGTDDEIAQIIGQRFIKSDKIAEDVKTTYSEELLNNTQYVGFYIDDKNLNFFYNSFMVAPYSEGMLEAYIPLNTEDVFKVNIETTNGTIQQP